MKTQFERYCELRNFDNWVIRNPRKSWLLCIVLGGGVFAGSQLLRMFLEWFARLVVGMAQ